jgi:hypothetical protein
MSNSNTGYLVKNMQRLHSYRLLLTVIAVLAMAACGDDSPSTGAASTAKPLPNAGGSGSMSPGKPSAPISIDYEVLGKAIVGLPVAINVRVRATQDTGPIAVHYSINDASSMRFQEGQVERREYRDRSELDMQQVAVVPQREGRLYINVSVEVQTPGGSMIKSMSIPIQVGNAPTQPQLNGELKEGPDGEMVISMPAQENR